MNPSIRILIHFLIAVCQVAVVAQGRVVDSYDSVWRGGYKVQWQLFAGELIATDDFTRKADEALSQIALPTGMHILDDVRCLFCGTDGSGAGRVELWEFGVAGSLTLLDSRTDAGRQYNGIAATSGDLYLLDAGADVLLSGSWDMTSPLASITTSVIAQSSTPGFPDADNWTLTVLDDDAPAMVPIGTGLGIQIVPGTSGQASLLPQSLIGGHNAYIIPVKSSAGDAFVTAIAANGTVFEVVRLGSGVIGIGVGMGAYNEVTVSLTESLLLGERYVARVLGQATPIDYAFECVRRYGQSEQLVGGADMQPFFYLAGATSENIINVHLALESPLSPSDSQYSGDLLIAFRLPTDPVAQLPDGRFLLSTSFTQPVSGWVVANTTRGSMSTSVPIPAGLTDFVFLVQYVVYEGGNFNLSQIYGAEIR